MEDQAPRSREEVQKDFYPQLITIKIQTNSTHPN